MSTWPLQNLPPAHLNRSGRQVLSRFFTAYDLASPADLRLWHGGHMRLTRNSPLAKLVDSESRELYLLAMFAGTPLSRLDYGYYLGYEWYSVGSALTQLDIPRIKVAHPNAIGVDQVIQDAIVRGFDSASSQTMYEWVGFNDRLLEQQNRFRFGYEPILQAVTVHALAYQAGVQGGDALQEIVDRDACLSITGFDASHDATAAGLEALNIAISSLQGERPQPQQWKHTLIRRFSGLYAHLWLYQGHPMPEVIERLQQRLELVVPCLFAGITPAQQVAMIRSTMATFVACYPSAWAIADIEPGDFLGCSLLDRELYRDLVRQTHESAFDGFVGKEAAGHMFPKLALDYLAKIDQRIYSPEYVDREGSRSRYWNSQVTDLTGSEDKVNSLMQADIWHPALAGPKVADMLVEDSAVEAVRAYLDKGGNAAGQLAEQMLRRYPLLLDRFVDAATRGSEVGRLASIASLSRTQIERIPERFRDIVLAVDLGL